MIVRYFVSMANSGDVKTISGLVLIGVGAVRRQGELRQRAKGIAASPIRASWLRMKAQSQGKAFSMKP